MFKTHYRSSHNFDRLGGYGFAVCNSLHCTACYGDATSGVLKVRALVVVDEKGLERVRIGAPIAGPNNSGLPVWRVPVSGIVLYGPDGKGRAGFVSTDTKSSHVCLRMYAEGSQAISLASPHDSDLCQ